jgi:hypothetical protein
MIPQNRADRCACSTSRNQRAPRRARGGLRTSYHIYARVRRMGTGNAPKRSPAPLSLGKYRAAAISARVPSAACKGSRKVGRTFKTVRGHPIGSPEVWLILSKANHASTYVKIALRKQPPEFGINETKNSRRPGQIFNNGASLGKGRMDRDNSEDSMEEDEWAHCVVCSRHRVFRSRHQVGRRNPARHVAPDDRGLWRLL